MYCVIRLTAFVFVMLLLTTGLLLAQAVPDLTGTWKAIANPDRQLKLQRNSNGTVYGTAVNDRQDKAKNGRVVLKDLNWNSRANAYEGTLLNPDGSDEIPVTVRVTGHDTFEFTVKKFFISRTFRFIRVHQLHQPAL